MAAKEEEDDGWSVQQPQRHQRRVRQAPAAADAAGAAAARNKKGAAAHDPLAMAAAFDAVDARSDKAKPKKSAGKAAPAVGGAAAASAQAAGAGGGGAGGGGDDIAAVAAKAAAEAAAEVYAEAQVDPDDLRIGRKVKAPRKKRHNKDKEQVARRGDASVAAAVMAARHAAEKKIRADLEAEAAREKAEEDALKAERHKERFVNVERKRRETIALVALTSALKAAVGLSQQCTATLFQNRCYMLCNLLLTGRLALPLYKLKLVATVAASAPAARAAAVQQRTKDAQDASSDADGTDGDEDKGGDDGDGGGEGDAGAAEGKDEGEGEDEDTESTADDGNDRGEAEAGGGAAPAAAAAARKKGKSAATTAAAAAAARSPAAAAAAAAATADSPTAGMSGKARRTAKDAADDEAHRLNQVPLNFMAYDVSAWDADALVPDSNPFVHADIAQLLCRRYRAVCRRQVVSALTESTAANKHTPDNITRVCAGAGLAVAARARATAAANDNKAGPLTLSVAALGPDTEPITPADEILAHTRLQVSFRKLLERNLNSLTMADGRAIVQALVRVRVPLCVPCEAFGDSPAAAAAAAAVAAAAAPAHGAGGGDANVTPAPRRRQHSALLYALSGRQYHVALAMALEVMPSRDAEDVILSWVGVRENRYQPLWDAITALHALVRDTAAAYRGEDPRTRVYHYDAPQLAWTLSGWDDVPCLVGLVLRALPLRVLNDPALDWWTERTPAPVLRFLLARNGATKGGAECGDIRFDRARPFVSAPSGAANDAAAVPVTPLQYVALFASHHVDDDDGAEEELKKSFEQRSYKSYYWYSETPETVRLRGLIETGRSARVLMTLPAVEQTYRTYWSALPAAIMDGSRIGVTVLGRMIQLYVAHPPAPPPLALPAHSVLQPTQLAELVLRNAEHAHTQAEQQGLRAEQRTDLQSLASFIEHQQSVLLLACARLQRVGLSDMEVVQSLHLHNAMLPSAHAFHTLLWFLLYGTAPAVRPAVIFPGDTVPCALTALRDVLSYRDGAALELDVPLWSSALPGTDGALPPLSDADALRVLQAVERQCCVHAPVWAVLDLLAHRGVLTTRALNALITTTALVAAVEEKKAVAVTAGAGAAAPTATAAAAAAAAPKPATKSKALSKFAKEFVPTGGPATVPAAAAAVAVPAAAAAAAAAAPAPAPAKRAWGAVAPVQPAAPASPGATVPAGAPVSAAKPAPWGAGKKPPPTSPVVAAVAAPVVPATHVAMLIAASAPVLPVQTTDVLATTANGGGGVPYLLHFVMNAEMATAHEFIDALFDTPDVDWSPTLTHVVTAGVVPIERWFVRFPTPDAVTRVYSLCHAAVLCLSATWTHAPNPDVRYVGHAQHDKRHASLQDEPWPLQVLRRTPLHVLNAPLPNGDTLLAVLMRRPTRSPAALEFMCSQLHGGAGTGAILIDYTLNRFGEGNRNGAGPVRAWERKGAAPVDADCLAPLLRAQRAVAKYREALPAALRDSPLQRIVTALASRGPARDTAALALLIAYIL